MTPEIKALLADIRGLVPLDNADAVDEDAATDSDRISRYTKCDLLDKFQDIRALLERAGLTLDGNGNPLWRQPSPEPVKTKPNDIRSQYLRVLRKIVLRRMHTLFGDTGIRCTPATLAADLKCSEADILAALDA